MIFLGYSPYIHETKMAEVSTCRPSHMASKFSYGIAELNTWSDWDFLTGYARNICFKKVIGALMFA